MKRSLMTGMGIALLAATLAVADTAVPAVVTPPVAAPAVNGKAPRIQFESLTYDCGKTSMVQSVAGKFIFKNTGEATLELKRPQPGCGCTVAEVKPLSMKLEPGEQGEISFSLTVGAHQGLMQKHINVPSNDPINPNVNLIIKVELEKLFEVLPAQVVCGDMGTATPTNFVVLVKRVDGNPLKIARVESSTPALAVSYEMIPNAVQPTVKIVVTPKSDGSNRQLFGTVSVYAEGISYAVATVPVFGRFVGEVRLIPEAVFWGIADPKKWPGQFADLMITRKIRVIPSKALPDFTMKNLTTDIKGATVTLESVGTTQVYGKPGETGKVYEIVAKLPVAPAETVKGAITFETNLPNSPLITIPVSINVLKR